MRVVIQRVTEASVTADGEFAAKISRGLLILLGIETNDSDEDISWLVPKISNLRIFGDSNGIMNLSVKEIGGEVLLISQFTLHASTKKGNRPSYIRAARPDFAIPHYEKFIRSLQDELGKKIQTGVFGADMNVSMINDGPVTIIIDSKNRE